MDIIATGNAFNDMVNSLRNEFKDNIENTVILLGTCWWNFKKYNEYRKKYKKIIVFQTEQLNATQRNFLTLSYFKWLKQADEVWDYDEQNIEVLKLIRPDVKLHIFKPYKDWSKYAPLEKDIDILFYGAMNEHRKKLLDHLAKKYKVKILHAWDDKTIDNCILRSKILLNIYFYYECSCQEQARIIRWIGAPCKIISEKSVKNYLNVNELTYNELFDL